MTTVTAAHDPGRATTVTDQARHLTPAEPPPDPEYDIRAPEIDERGRLAEKLLVASLLTRPEDAATLLPALDPTDFHNPTFETIWNTAADIYADGHTPDHLALLSALTGDKTFHRFGGPNLLLELRDHAPLTPDPDRYAREVRDAARWRRTGQALRAATQAYASARPDTLEQALGQLSDIADRAATTFGPPTLTPAETGLRDLSWIRDGKAPATPEPAWCRRTDEHALFYQGKVNGLFGDPESGKTWLAQCAIIEALAAGKSAAMIDVDHNGMDATAARLLLLGARPEHLWNPDIFRYYEPEDAHELRAAVKDITTLAPTITVLDSLGEILPILGVSSKDNDEITGALRTIVQPPADAGSCVITIDHLPKSHEARSTGFAIGGTAKKRAINGAYLRVNSKTKPAPGQIGRSVLIIEKDRAGGLRKTSAGGWAGELVLDSTHDSITTWTITRDAAPVSEDGTFRPTETMEKVSRYIEANPGCTGRDITDTLGGRRTTVAQALQILITEGMVSRQQGARRSWVHHSQRVYRADDDGAHTPTDDQQGIWP